MIVVQFYAFIDHLGSGLPGQFYATYFAETDQVGQVAHNVIRGHIRCLLAFSKETFCR